MIYFCSYQKLQRFLQPRKNDEETPAGVLPLPVWVLWSEGEAMVLQAAFLFSILLLDVFEAYSLVSLLSLVNLLSSLDVFVLENYS